LLEVNGWQQIIKPKKKALLWALLITRRALAGIVERPDMPSLIAPRQRIKQQLRSIVRSSLIKGTQVIPAEETYLLTGLQLARSHRKRERLTRELLVTGRSSGVELANVGLIIKRANMLARKMKQMKRKKKTMVISVCPLKKRIN